MERFGEMYTVGTPSEGFTLDNTQHYIKLPVGVHGVAEAVWLSGEGGGRLPTFTLN